MPTLRAPDPSALLAEAQRLTQSGQHAGARAAYETYLRENPGDVAALNNLAALRFAAGDFSGAADALRSLCERQPGNPAWHCNLGHALIRAGRPGEAIGPLETAIKAKPDYVDAHNNLGVAWRALRDRHKAEIAFRSAFELQPDSAQVLNNLCDLLIDDDDLDGARAILDTSLDRVPGNRTATFKLGYVELLAGNLARANALLERDAQSTPPYPLTFLNLGTLASWEHRSEEAEAHFRHALALNPDFDEATENLGYELLRQRRYREGWKLFEVRRSGTAARDPDRSIAAPLWDGKADPKLRLLVTLEQGLGDVIQFARFIRLARRRVGHLTLVVDGYWRPLNRLLSNLEGVDAMVGLDTTDVAVSVRCPLLSLPAIMALDDQDLRVDAPYLAPDDADVARWRTRISPSGALNVGLAWAGNARPEQKNCMTVDRRRSVSLETLSPVLDAPGIRFHSLQKGSAGPAEPGWPGGGRMRDDTAELKDMADTAALMANLDLVITVDTSVAHLAGAIGRPVWMLNRFDSCWRWSNDGETTLWYPTMRIFRQQTMGDWSTVVAEVHDALVRLASSDLSARQAP